MLCIFCSIHSAFVLIYADVHFNLMTLLSFSKKVLDTARILSVRHYPTGISLTRALHQWCSFESIASYLVYANVRNHDDVTGNLIVIKSVSDLLNLIKALSDRFNGLGKLKNPFSIPEEQQAQRSHLLLMNITVIYEDEKSYGETFSEDLQTKEIKDMLTTYKEKVQMLPQERWNSSIDKALTFMTETSLAIEPVRVTAEVQVLFSYDMIVRGKRVKD